MQKKYDVLGVVGEGAYGIVYKCRNKETGKYVAIKKFKEIEDKLVQKTMKRELKMLQLLKHDNVVDFQEAFIYKKNLFLVFEYVEKNLLEVLEKSPDGLNPKLIRSIIFQMCKAVHYLHINNIIHRDVKPENLLIDENMNLKLCDFGFARKITLNSNNNNVNAMTDYVATRWYRSPVLLLSKGIYGPEVDYWAIGCIMGELADGNPMFPGENEVDQLDCIIKVLGNLPQDLVDMFYDNPLYNGKDLLKVSRPESLERKYMGKLGPTAIDFLKGLLQIDPKKRINDETVFKHKYFTSFMKEPENQYILDLYEKRNNTNNNYIIENDIKKEISNIEIENNNKNIIQTKVINNTTNINIINYNNYNNTVNNKNYNENENDSSTNRTKDHKMEINCSLKSINDNKTMDNNKKSNPNISDENNYNTKKSLSVNKEKKKFGNIKIHNNYNNVKFSLSQGKTNQKNNDNNHCHNTNPNTLYNNIKHSIQNSFNIKKINTNGNNYKGNNSNSNIARNDIKNLNNYYNTNNNDIMTFANTNIDGYKTFFNINKSKDKYNFKINQGYIREEGKKYSNQKINVNNNVIDENEEYLDISQKKKSTSKEKKKNGQLFVKHADNYKLNFNNINNKNGGYGTFYKYNMKNTNFGGFNKKKNTSQLPQLFNNGNGSNHKNKLNSKNKFKYY